MLLELSVENLAIIDRATVTFSPELTVLTGETGAGKSLVVDAIELVLGSRADSALVRSGATRAVVTAAFDLSSRPDVEAVCAELGVDLESSVLFIQREVFAEGKSQTRLCGKLAPVGVLKTLGALLVDFHGQHEHQILLHPERHLAYLDSFAGNEALREAARQAYEHRRQIAQRLADLRLSQRDRESRIDLLNYQVKEIESARIEAGEAASLENRLSRLRHAEKLAEYANHAIEALDSEGAGALGVALRQLEQASRLDESIGEVAETLRSALIYAQEARSALGSYVDSLEADPAALEHAIQRQDLLKRLFRKYGESEDEVLAFFEAAQEELAALELGEAGAAQVEADLAEAESVLRARCAELTQSRSEASRLFAERVESELQFLAMANARFEVQIEPSEPGANGADKVEFLFSANEGEPLQPLARIASGGELSRVMLAIKCAMAKPNGALTAVFDEVDAGLGGVAALEVGRKLAELASNCQVLVVTHLAQIAGRATTHFLIQKTTRDGRTVTEIEALQGDARVGELARMLSGDVGDTSLAHAREILQR